MPSPASQVIEFVSDLVKRQKCRCDPMVVDALLNVAFSEIPTLSKEGMQLYRFWIQGTSSGLDKKEKKTSKNRRRKMFKIRDALEKQGKDFEVHKSAKDKQQENKARQQTETVEALFEIFFRVLKHCSHHVHSRSHTDHEESVHVFISETCPLLAVSLKGLAKYAHIMSVEYFEDLLQVDDFLLS